MFTVSKNARIHESVASKTHSQADIANMKRESGSLFYAFPCEIDVIGCGDEAPADYDPTKRTRFEKEYEYDTDDLLVDIRTLADKHGVPLMIDIVNRGLDLEIRAKARPKPSAKMSESDKVAFLVIKHPEIMGTLNSLAEYAKWYDENVAA